jgi:hypothetical protein
MSANQRGHGMFKPYMWSLVIFCALAWAVSAYAQQKKDKTADKKAKKADVGAQEESPGQESGKDREIEKQAPAEEKPRTDVRKGAYTVRLRDLEDRVNRLKEQIFRSKARLSLLAETVLDRKIAGSKAVIVFRNEMGGSFRLAKAIFLLDGAPIFNKSDEGGSLSDLEVLNLFDGPVMPGDHTLSVVLNYRGHGYGIFSYLKGYSFKTRSSRTFTVNEGKALRLEVIGNEKGGVTTPLEERPDIKYIMNVSDYEEASAQASEPESAEE